MADEDLGLMAHLLRRAGFGATREELEAYAAQGYDEVVEDLVDIERCPPVDEDILHRYIGGEGPPVRVGAWIFRMINSRRPLEEKMALFWHHVPRHRIRQGRACPRHERPDRSVPSHRHDQYSRDSARGLHEPGYDQLARQQ